MQLILLMMDFVLIAINRIVENIKVLQAHYVYFFYFFLPAGFYNKFFKHIFSRTCK